MIKKERKKEVLVYIGKNKRKAELFFTGAKLCFLVLRHQTSTIQTILSMTADTVSKQMIKYAVGIPLESIVVVEGTLQKPLEDVKTCSISKVEIRLDKIFVLAEAPAKLPFLLEDASRPVDALPKVRTLLFCSHSKINHLVSE